jgi:hypothetical protein
MEGISRSTRPEMEGHAGEWETLSSSSFFPELVDCDIAQRLQPNVSYDADAFRAETVNYQILSNGTGYLRQLQQLRQDVDCWLSAAATWLASS